MANSFSILNAENSMFRINSDEIRNKCSLLVDANKRWIGIITLNQRAEEVYEYF